MFYIILLLCRIIHVYKLIILLLQDFAPPPNFLWAVSTHHFTTCEEWFNLWNQTSLTTRPTSLSVYIDAMVMQAEYICCIASTKWKEGISQWTYGLSSVTIFRTSIASFVLPREISSSALAVVSLWGITKTSHHSAPWRQVGRTPCSVVNHLASSGVPENRSMASCITLAASCFICSLFITSARERYPLTHSLVEGGGSRAPSVRERKEQRTV